MSDSFAMRNPHGSRSRRGWVLALHAALACFLLSFGAAAETRDIKVPKTLVRAAIKAYVGGIQLTVDNWDKFQNGSWHHNGSRILMPNGQSQTLNIPKSPEFKTLTRRYNAYIDDMRSREPDVYIDGDQIKIEMPMESAGDEWHIGCINRRKDEPCTVHGLDHTGQIDNANVALWLDVLSDNGKVSLKVAKARADFDLKPDSRLLSEVKALVDRFKDTGALIQKEANRVLAQQIEKANVQESLTVDLNKEIIARAMDALPLLGEGARNWLKDNLKITKVRGEGNNFVISVSYPDPVSADSLKIVRFEADKVDASGSCPANVPFRATILTKYPMSGQVWLRNENGTTTAKLPWRNGKDQTTTSPISRPWPSQTQLKKVPGRTELVVSFKDALGKTVEKRSAPVDFTWTCAPPTNKLVLR